MTLSATSTVSLKLSALQSSLRQNRRDLLNRIGERLLELASDDFARKMRGEAGDDGTTWKPVTSGAIYKRAQRRPSGQANLAARRSLTAEERQIMSRVRRLLPRGESKSQNRKAIVARELADDPAYQQLRSERTRLKQEMKALANAQDTGLIGYDQGDLLACFIPGYVAPDGGGNVLEIDDNSVEVGVDRIYAEAFDEIRPIMPNSVPQNWITELERTVERGIEKSLNSQ